MDYMIEFGRNENYDLVQVCGCMFDSKNPMEDFEYYAKTLKMYGEDFSDMDYVALFKNTNGNYHSSAPMAIKIIK